MGTQAIPDFSDLQYKTPPEAPGTPKDTVPDFSDLKYQTTSFGDHLGPRLRGILDGLSGIGDMVLDTGAALIGPSGKGDIIGDWYAPLDIINKFSPEMGADILRRQENMRTQGAAAQQMIGAGVQNAIDTKGASLPPAAGHLLKSLLYDMPLDAIKAVTGVDPTSATFHDIEGDHMSPFGGAGKSVAADFRSLSDEELEAASKATTANVISYVVGSKMSTASQEMFSGLRPYVGGKGIAAIGRAKSAQEIQGII